MRHFGASLLGHERGGRALPSVGRQIYMVWRRSATKFLNERAYALLDISLVIMLGLVMGAIQVRAGVRSVRVLDVFWGAGSKLDSGAVMVPTAAGLYAYAPSVIMHTRKHILTHLHPRTHLQGHTSSITKVPETAILVILAFALTSLVTGLRTFGQEQLIFLTREAQAGLSVMSWMLGRIGWDLILQVCVGGGGGQHTAVCMAAACGAKCCCQRHACTVLDSDPDLHGVPQRSAGWSISQALPLPALYSRTLTPIAIASSQHPNSQPHLPTPPPPPTLQGLYPALYLGFYYAMTVFDTPFELYYLVLFFVAWWGFGVGYLFSVLLESNNALLGGLCVTLIFGGIINGINPSVAASEGNVLLTGLQYMSYTRWAVEAVFIGTATPTSSSLVFLTAGAMSQLGFCDMHNHLGSFDGGLDPSNLAAAFRPVFEQQYNTTLDSGNSTSTSSSDTGNSMAVAFLYRVYQDPGVVDRLCRTAFMQDILWLWGWGMITRLAAFFVLLYKVERRMTTASVFG